MAFLKARLPSRLTKAEDVQGQVRHDRQQHPLVAVDVKHHVGRVGARGDGHAGRGGVGGVDRLVAVHEVEDAVRGREAARLVHLYG